MDSPSFITYSTVVSRDSMRILLLVAALNDLEIMGANIQNALLSAPNLENHWIKAGSKFGAEQGKTFLFLRALYGLKSASALFRSFMAKKIDKISFKSCVVDPDVFIRPEVRYYRTEYHKYILMYVDDILAILVDATSILKILEGDTVQLKNGNIASPKIYLGAKLQKKVMENIECWMIGSFDYAQAAIATVEEGLKNKRWKLPNKVMAPMVQSYLPDLDGSP